MNTQIPGPFKGPPNVQIGNGVASSLFPLFEAAARRSLRSTSDDGLAALLTAASRSWHEVEDNFRAFETGDDAKLLCAVLDRLAMALDMPDIRLVNVPLRAGFDVADQGVRAGIFRCAIVALCHKASPGATVVVDAIVGSQASVPSLLVQGQLALNIGDFDKAILAARRAVAMDSACPPAQRLLYDAFVGKKKLGDDTKPDVALQDLKGRFCPQPFEVNDVADPRHADHQELLAILSDSHLKHPKVQMFNVVIAGT